MRYNRQSFTTGETENNSERGNVKLLFGVIWCRVGGETRAFFLKLITFLREHHPWVVNAIEKLCELIFGPELLKQSLKCMVHTPWYKGTHASKQGLSFLCGGLEPQRLWGISRAPQHPCPFFRRSTSSYHSPSSGISLMGEKATCLTITCLKFKYTQGDNDLNV